MTGAEMIAAERERQITNEGWTPDHDSHHDRDQLLGAANCYLGAVALRRVGEPNGRIRQLLGLIPEGWPWQPFLFKPKNDVRDLVRAGALIAAEIDRLQHAEGTV
jgi:hypothetical protein